MSESLVLRIAIPSPLRRSFDYLPPEAGGLEPPPGVRVEVPFGKRIVTGVLLETATKSSIPSKRLRHAIRVLDEDPVLPPDLMTLLRWGSSYYHHPIGEVIHGALPALLRKGGAARLRPDNIWQLTGSGRNSSPDELGRAPRQAELLKLLQKQSTGLPPAELDQRCPNWRPAMLRLQEKGLVEPVEVTQPVTPAISSAFPAPEPPVLNRAQQNAVDTVVANAGSFSVTLLEGVTGSGKTEVYIRIVEQIIGSGRQALILVPEIGLTPQLLERFALRFSGRQVVQLHSALSDRQRLAAWLAAGNASAPIVIGTRSALFTPLKKPGVIILDEEHDPSFKQQEGFRYSTRDMAIMRARNAGIPVLLGSATPSLESLYNVSQQRYRHLTLPERAGAASSPEFRLLDLRRQPMQEGVSSKLLEIMKQHLQRDGQILLFLNRRGYAPTLLCHECGWVGRCHRCDAHLTLHQQQGRLRCHHCGSEQPLGNHCPECGSVDLRALGAGTERIEKVLQSHFPDTSIARLDRDSTSRKGSMQSLLGEIRAGHRRILIGTQMLTKGHHFPDVTLVGILDADQGLFSADFRASERMSQLIIQVAGRAGRAERPGMVVVQTHHPEHPLLLQLITEGYSGFARSALRERHSAELPPFRFIALLRAEATDRRLPLQFLREAHLEATRLQTVDITPWEPVPAPMEKRAGRYRAQLLLQSTSRRALHELLGRLLPRLESRRSGRRVRWSLDVDPVDLF